MAGWTPRLYQLSVLTASTSTSWISPLSTLSASESVRWKSSFSKNFPLEVGKSITGRPNLPNQRNSISRPSDPLHHLPYSRYMDSVYPARGAGSSDQPTELVHGHVKRGATDDPSPSLRSGSG